MKKITILLFMMLLAFSWQSNAQSTINITTSGGSFTSEKWVSLTTEADGGGTLVWGQGATQCDDAGLINVDIDLAPGIYYVNCYDKYDDSWDGTLISVTAYGAIIGNNGGVTPDDGEDTDVDSTCEGTPEELEASFEIIVPLAPTCVGPTTLTATGITSSTADLAWTEAGTATLWNVEIVDAGVAATGNATASGVTNPYTAMGLTETTDFEFYVQADCGMSDVSPWIGPFAFSTIASCPIPTELVATATGVDTVDLSWGAGGSETDWTYEYGVAPYLQGDGGITGSVTTSSMLSLSGLTPGESYDIYVQANCGIDSGDSAYTTVSWAQPIIGGICETAIEVATLPYNTSDDTSNYGDNYSSSPGATGCGITGSYLNGDDVVYAYTATSDATINIAMSEIGSTYSGLFVYTDCANIGTECVAGFGNGFGDGTDDYSLEVSVTNGTTYYIVLSTWATPQSTTYTLDITENTCVNAEVTYTTIADCANAQFSVNVDVTSLGTATSVTVSDDQGSADQQVSTTGVVTFGPYVSGTSVNYTVLNDQDASCEIMELVSFTCPPNNDDCLNATVLTPGGVFADNPVDGTVAGATADEEAASCGSDGSGVWYSVVVPASGDITFEVGPDSDTGTTTFDSVIEAFTGTCGALTSIDCDDDGAATANFSELTLTGLVAGETVYFRVWEYGGNDVEPFSVSAFSATLSVGDFENEATFTYYPNPVKNALTLNAKNTIEQVAMYNMLGQEVLRANPKTLNSNLDMSTLQTGTYFVKVTIGNVTETIRVIKQ